MENIWHPVLDVSGSFLSMSGQCKNLPSSFNSSQISSQVLLIASSFNSSQITLDLFLYRYLIFLDYSESQ